MAHAGTTSTSSGQIGLWKALLAAIVIAAIGIGMVMAVPFITGGRATTAPADDRGYDQIENQRGATTLSGVAVDTNSAVQKAAAAKARAMSGVPADTSYEAVENARGVAPLTGAGVDRRFDDIEARRGATTLP
jgi:hypothetical protein